MFSNQLLISLLLWINILYVSATPTQRQPLTTTGPPLFNGVPLIHFRLCCINFIRVRGICVECPPGKYGTNCTYNCPDNNYGILCQQRCNCLHGFSCSSIYGCVPLPIDEVCPEGKTGTNCTKNCDPGYYGINCEKKCSCEAEQYCNSEKGCRDIIGSGRNCSSCGKDIKGVLSNGMMTEKVLNTTMSNMEYQESQNTLWITRNAVALVTALSVVATGSLITLLLMVLKRQCNIELNKTQPRHDCGKTSILLEGTTEEILGASMPERFTCNKSQEQLSNRQCKNAGAEKDMYEESSKTQSKNYHDYTPLNKPDVENKMLECTYETCLKRDGVCHPYAVLSEQRLSSSENLVSTTTNAHRTQNSEEGDAEPNYEEICENNEAHE